MQVEDATGLAVPLAKGMSGGHDRHQSRDAHRGRACTVPLGRRRRADRALHRVAPHIHIIAYLNGYAGLLTGKSVEVTDKVRATASRLHAFGGSPIGNSRVRLTNVEDCVKRGLIEPGEDPLQVAAEQLRRDGVGVLHTIGGDDTNGTAADLAAYLSSHGYQLTVVGLPKTIDNDVIPIKQTLGAWTAAEQGALYARNIIAEILVQSAGADRPRGDGPQLRLADRRDGAGAPSVGQGRGLRRVAGKFGGAVGCAWSLCARAAVRHRARDDASEEDHGRAGRCEPVHFRGRGGEGDRRRDGGGGRNGAARPIRPRPARQDQSGRMVRQAVRRRARGGEGAGPEERLFRASAPANEADLKLIAACTAYAVDAALRGELGVVGQDEERGDELRAIEFERIAGGKKFDVTVPWFRELLGELGQG